MVIGGKYEMVASDRYDEFLKCVGASMIERNQVWKYNPLMEFSQTDNGWKQTEKGAKNSEISFVSGQEFEEEFCGRKLKSKIILEGNRLIHQQRIGPVEAIIQREFNGSEMISVFRVGDTTARRVFRKIE